MIYRQSFSENVNLQRHRMNGDHVCVEKIVYIMA